MKKIISLVCILLCAQGWSQVEDLKKQLNTTSIDTTRARLMFRIGWQLKDFDPLSSLAYADSAYQITIKDQPNILFINCLKLKGILERNFGNYQKSLDYCHQALQLSMEANETSAIASSLNECGNTYSKLNDFENAGKYFDMAIKLCVQTGNADLLIKVLSNKALILDTQGKMGDALHYYYASLKIGLNTHNEEATANTKANLGFLYAKLGRFKDAIKFTKEAASTYQKLNNKGGLAKTISNLASIDFMTGNLPQALIGYQTSLKIAEEQNDQEGIQADVNNMGGVLASMGRFDESIVWMKRAMALGKKSNNKKTVTNAYVNLSDIYLMMGDLTKAVQYGDTGKTMALEAGLLNQLFHAYNNLFRAHLAANNYKGAFENFEQFIFIRDSLYSIDAAKKTKELEIKYQVEAGQKQLQLLEEKEKVRKLEVQRKNYLIAALAGGILFILGMVTIVVVILISRAQKKDAIFAQKKAELEHQALRAQMNPHFIFNSLNSIQRLYVEGKTNEANEYMADFSVLMRKILDNSTKNKISLKEELDTLRLYLEMEKLRCGHLLEYKIHVDPEIDPINAAVPPMIIQPFVENSIWHGILPKKQKGTVSVIITGSTLELFCSVEDDGIGFSQKTNHHQSKGISLIEKRLNTKVTIEPLSPGTRISFKII